jgi:hypothetical protein
MQQSFFFNFVAIIIGRRFSQIWLQAKNMISIIQKYIFIFGYPLEPGIEEIWRLFLDFGRFMAIDNFPQFLFILAVLIFLMSTIWLHIYI